MNSETRLDHADQLPNVVSLQKQRELRLAKDQPADAQPPEETAIERCTDGVCSIEWRPAKKRTAA